MIAVTTQTNPLTCVVKETAPLAGRDVQASPTIVAFLNGCSAMEKTIVVITATSCQKTAQFVKRKRTSSARTIAAFLNSGLVTLLMIAAMVLMNRKLNAKENTENVLNLNSIATTENVFPADGAVVRTSNNDLENHRLILSLFSRS